MGSSSPVAATTSVSKISFFRKKKRKKLRSVKSVRKNTKTTNLLLLHNNKIVLIMSTIVYPMYDRQQNFFYKFVVDFYLFRRFKLFFLSLNNNGLFIQTYNELKKLTKISLFTFVNLNN